MKKLCIALALVFVCLSAPTQVAAADGSLSGRVIILDAGHGRGSGGSYAGYVEAVRMFFLAQQIQNELERRGATVHMTRNSSVDVYITLRPALSNRWSIEAIRRDRLARLSYEGILPIERARLVSEIHELDYLLAVLDRILADHIAYAPIYMNYPWDSTLSTAIHPTWRRVFEFQADPIIRYNWLFISLHSNATGTPINHARNGADVFYSANYNARNAFYFANYSHQDISRLFGDKLLDNIALMGINRNNVTPNHFLVIRETNLPAVLVENGFHTNANDRALLQNDSFMRGLATIYADTIEAYFAAINQ